MGHVLLLHQPSLRPACEGDLVLFFDREGETWDERLAREAQAKAICAGCPILDACRAAHERERFGIWAGENEDERRCRLRRERRRKAS